MTVYWVVWDAAAAWIVDRLSGTLPAVRRLRARGAYGAARPPRPNCQTPSSLATLFTGTWPVDHGVTGFTMPDPTGAVTAEVSGFGPGFPRVPPVWETLGRRGAFVHVPWVFDGAGNVGSYVDAAVEAYSGRVARHDHRVIGVGERAHWSGLELVGEADGVRVAGRALRPADGWAEFRVANGLGTWARCLPGDGGWTVVRTGIWRVRVAGADPCLVGGLRAAPAFAGEGVGSLYRAGVFGPRLPDGGDGTAEDVFLSSLECVAGSFGAAADAVLAGHDAGLVVIYLPITDDIGHELIGWCDEASAAYRPGLAPAIWERVARCYGWADALLGRVLDRAGPADTVILGADHGITGGAHVVHLGERLVRTGLAACTATGELDPARSAVVYHPANNGSLWVNRAGRPHGLVPDEEVADTMARAMAALGEITDPADGRPVVAGFADETGRPLSPGAATDVAYVVLADDYQPTAALGAGPLVRRAAKTGTHVVNAGNARLHATFAAAGPGIAPGDLGVVDNTLAAELIVRQLGTETEPSTRRLFR